MELELTAHLVGLDDVSRPMLESIVRDLGLRPRIVGSLAQVETYPDLVIVESALLLDASASFLAGFREHGVVVVAIVRDAEQDADDEAALGRLVELGVDELLRAPIRRADAFSRCRAALRLMRHRDELQTERRATGVLCELTGALTSAFEMREVLFAIVRRLEQALDARRVSLVAAPEGRGSAYVLVTSDDPEVFRLELDLADYPEIRQVLRTRETLALRNATTHPMLDSVRERMLSSEACSLDLFPLVWEDRATAVLIVRTDPRRGTLSETELLVCRSVANATAVSLRSARIMESLMEHADGTTLQTYEAERRLHSLRRYADFFSLAAEGIAVFDRAGNLLFANPRAYETVGYAPGSGARLHIRDLVHRGSLGALRELGHEFDRGIYRRGVDLRLKRRDGRAAIVSASFAALPEGEGGILVSFQDVTDHRATEAELVKTMQFLESLIDASVDGIVAADIDGNILLFNDSAERIYGFQAAQVIGRMTIQSLYAVADAQRMMELLRSESHGGRGKLAPTRMVAIAKDGSEIPIRLSAAIVEEDGQEAAVVAIFTDLRETLRVQERLAAATEKLASTEKQALIAELAGTAAHELNQPLTTILAYGELLRRQLEKESASRRAVDAVLQEAERMAEIVRKIGKMTKYETKSYVGGQKIIDLDRAAGSDPAPGGEPEGESDV